MVLVDYFEAVLKAVKDYRIREAHRTAYLQCLANDDLNGPVLPVILEPDATHVRMGSSKASALIEAAFAMRNPSSFLISTADTFRRCGRWEDANTANYFAALCLAGEIEVLLGLKRKLA